jgi:alpha-tubulin suppressor-like RCC1 family protein
MVPIMFTNPLHTHRIASLSAGFNHTVALSTAGMVWSWGSGANGQLGHGSDCTQTLVPKVVSGLQSEKTVSVAAGHYHTVSCISAGNCYSWGMGKDGQLGQGDDDGKDDLFEATMIRSLAKEVCAKKVWAGGFHTGALGEPRNANAAAKVMGACMYMWGRGTEGQLGHNDRVSRYSPEPCTGTSYESISQQQITQVEFGGFHSAMLTTNGAQPGDFEYKCAFWIWGHAEHGQQGVWDDGRGAMFEDMLVPTRHPQMCSAGVESFSCGVRHTIVLSSKGALYTFGNSRNGQLGHGDQETMFDPCAHMLGSTARGRIEWVMEAGLKVETHNGSMKKPSENKMRFVSVAAGAYHSLAVDDQGALYSWGLPDDGRLGHGDLHEEMVVEREEPEEGYLPIAQMYPRRVEGLAGVVIDKVHAGWSHSFAFPRKEPTGED